MPWKTSSAMLSAYKETWVTLEEKNQDIRIIIDDNGPGIPKKHHQDVLKPSFEWNHPATPRPEALAWV